jgi:membrane-associated phospholipid phosphatase
MKTSYAFSHIFCGCAALVLLSGGTVTIRAEEKKSVAKETIDHIWRDQRRMFTAPLRTSRNDLLVWGAAGTSLLVLAPEWGGHRSWDERFEQNINRSRGPARSFLRAITHAGDPPILIGTSLAMYGVGYWGEHPRLAAGSLHVFEGLIDTGIVLTLVKAIAGRSRPIDRPIDSDFHGPLGFFSDSENDSFPSGHSALSFAAATIVSHESANRWVGLSAYSLATAVSYSRIYVEKHWASDVIAGAVLGYSIGVLVEKHRHAREEKTSRIVPAVQNESVGLAWVKTW